MKHQRISKQVRPQDYIRYVKKYMESQGLQPIVILGTDETYILRIEDNLENLSKFSKTRKVLNSHGLEFNWRNIPSEILPQIEISIQSKGGILC